MEKPRKIVVESAEHWYSVAIDSIKIGNYDTAVYGMEMSLEIGLKGILIKNRVEYPKIHDVTAVLKSKSGSLRLGKPLNDKLDEILGIFQILLKYRNDAGYMFSGGSDQAALKKVATEHIGKVREYLDLLRKEIL